MHLGMSGNLGAVPATTARLKHDHFDLLLDSGMALRFNDPRRFGSLLYAAGNPKLHPLLKDLALEPLSAAFDGEYLMPRHARARAGCRSRRW